MDDKKDIIRPIARNPRGFSDFRGAGLLHRSSVVSKILESYQKSGFEYLETPAFEYADCLGKFLPDSDRPNEGVFALLDDDEQWMALRYDLTAPLARFVAQNFDALPKPYRRCAAGPVWRNEKPGPGRFREFWQCDADIIGSPRPEADAEIIATLSNGLAATGIDKSKFVVKVSNRKLLDGLLFEIGVDPSDNFKRLTILRAVDKLDRLGEDGVALLLGAGRKDASGDFTKGAGLDDNAIAKVIAFTQTKKETRQASLDALSNVIGNTEIGNEGLEELGKISLTLTALGLDETSAEFDPAIVRGLEYYTGTVFEAEFLGETIDEKGNPVRFGSVGSGGRYDDLVMRFKGERVPATGCSIGVSRLLAALALSESEKQVEAGPVVILAMDNDQIAGYFQMAQELRNAGIAAEVYLGTSGMKAQMKYADRRNAPLVIMEGSNERAEGIVTIKDLALGAKLATQISDNEEWRKGRPAQSVVKRSELAAEVKKLLENAL